jgi:hypothetical protein
VSLANLAWTSLKCDGYRIQRLLGRTSSFAFRRRGRSGFAIGGNARVASRYELVATGDEINTSGRAAGLVGRYCGPKAVLMQQAHATRLHLPTRLPDHDSERQLCYGNRVAPSRADKNMKHISVRRSRASAVDHLESVVSEVPVLLRTIRSLRDRASQTHHTFSDTGGAIRKSARGVLLGLVRTESRLRRTSEVNGIEVTLAHTSIKVNTLMQTLMQTRAKTPTSWLHTSSRWSRYRTTVHCRSCPPRNHHCVIRATTFKFSPWRRTESCLVAHRHRMVLQSATEHVWVALSCR